MPSTSKTQYRFFRMAAMDKEFAKKHKISHRTAKEWHDEDKKKKKEDPDWWDELPEKSEKELKKHIDAVSKESKIPRTFCW